MKENKKINQNMVAVRRFLESANEALMECKRLRRRVDKLSIQCEKLVLQKGLVHPGEKLEELWRLLEEERGREIEAVRREMKCYRAVEDFIAALPDPIERTVLRRRYLDGETTWTRIGFFLQGDGVHYSERQLYRLYDSAMTSAAALWCGDGAETSKAYRGNLRGVPAERTASDQCGGERWYRENCVEQLAK